MSSSENDSDDLILLPKNSGIIKKEFSLAKKKAAKKLIVEPPRKKTSRKNGKKNKRKLLKKKKGWVPYKRVKLSMPCESRGGSSEEDAVAVARLQELLEVEEAVVKREVMEQESIQKGVVKGVPLTTVPTISFGNVKSVAVESTLVTKSASEISNILENNKSRGECPIWYSRLSLDMKMHISELIGDASEPTLQLQNHLGDELGTSDEDIKLFLNWRFKKVIKKKPISILHRSGFRTRTIGPIDALLQNRGRDFNTEFKDKTPVATRDTYGQYNRKYKEFCATRDLNEEQKESLPKWNPNEKDG